MRFAALAASFGAVVASAAHAGEPNPIPMAQTTPAEGLGALLEPASTTAQVAPAPKPTLDAIDRIVAELRPRIASLRARLQCVPYARAESGVALQGDASTWWRQAAGRYVRSKEPSEGAVLVMRGYNNPNRGHVAVVRRVLSDRKIVIDHANWLNQGEITVNVPVEDVSAKGDWSEVRVWHIPSGQWGRRVYAAQGFIEAERPIHASIAEIRPIS